MTSPLMNNTIRRMHCRYHWVGPREDRDLAAARLDRAARGGVTSLLGDALDQFLSDDPRVMVARKIDVKLVLNLGEHPTDASLERQWTRALLQSITRQIDLFHESTHSSNLRVFENQSDYLHAFLRELIRPEPGPFSAHSVWSRWCFRPLHKYQRTTISETIQAILLDYNQETPHVLARFAAEEGGLENLLAKLGEEGARTLWTENEESLEHTRTNSIAAADSLFRPIFAAAWSIVLAMIVDDPRTVPSSTIGEQWFQRYLTTNPLPPDWRDQWALTQSVAQLARYLLEQLQASVTCPLSPSRLKEMGLDWLDTDQLAATLEHELKPAPRRVADLALPDALQRRLFEAAWAIVTEVVPTDPDSPSDDPESPFERLFRRYLATSPRLPFERDRDPDRQSLGRAVAAIARFLRLQLPSLDPPRPTATSLEQLGLDWLDADTLNAAHVESEPASADPSRVDPSRTDPSRARLPRGKATRRDQLLDDLSETLRAARPIQRESPPDSAANALRLLTALVGRFPFWSGDPLVKPVIDRILTAWSAHRRASEVPSDHAPTADRILSELGPKASVIVSLLADAEPLPVGNSSANRDNIMAESLKTDEPIDSSQSALPEIQHRPTSSVSWTNPSSRPRATWSRKQVIELPTGAAGLFLLLRPLLDLRVFELAQSWSAASGADGTKAAQQARLVLVALSRFWAGTGWEVERGAIDPGVLLLAGLMPEMHLEWRRQNLVEAIESMGPVDPIESRWIRILRGHRWMLGDSLRLARVELAPGRSMLALGDAREAEEVWPLGVELIPGETSKARIAVDRWTTHWAELAGKPPVLLADPRTLTLLGLSIPTDQSIEPNPTSLTDDLRCVSPACLGLPADAFLALASLVIARAWARWLKRFARSTPLFLLEQCLRRPGRLMLHDDRIEVQLAARPLDVVLELSGCFEPLERTPWLPRATRFRIVGENALN